MDDGTLHSLETIPVLHSSINLLNWHEEACYYQNARHFTESGEVPIRGQGKKKPQGDRDALKFASDIFRDQAKNGDLNLPLDQPGISIPNF